MKHVVTALIVFAGLINFAPVVAIASSESLARFYDIPAPEGDLLILMRHRALLFGILGALLFAAAFRQHLRPAALVAGLVSMLGFIVLAWSQGGYGPSIHKAVIFDLVASVALGVAWFLDHRAADPA